MKQWWVIKEQYRQHLAEWLGWQVYIDVTLNGYLFSCDVRNDKYSTWTGPAAIVTWLPHPVHGELGDRVLIGLIC